MQMSEELKPPTYRHLQNKKEFDFVAKTIDWEVYRTKDGLFVIIDLVTHDCITLEHEDVPQLLELAEKMYRIEESETDSTPEEELI